MPGCPDARGECDPLPGMWSASRTARSQEQYGGMGTKTEQPSARKDSQTRHRRRWPWITLGVAGGVLLAAILGTGWYVSGLLGDAMRSEHSPAEPDLMVTSVADGRVEYTYDAGYSGWIDQGLLALSTADGGWTQTSDPQASGTGSRAIGEQQSPPALSAGQRRRDLTAEEGVVPCRIPAGLARARPCARRPPVRR